MNYPLSPGNPDRRLRLTEMILDAKYIRKCHITTPGDSKPIGAIVYNNQYYAYVKLFSTADSAQRAIDRLAEKGKPVLLTETRKGLVLWVLEPEARPVGKSLTR